MADIRGFSAYVARADLADRLSALPYDVYSQQEARAYVAGHPLSFLAIDRGESTLGEGASPYGEEAYAASRRLLEERISQGYYTKEEGSYYYLYRLAMGGRSQTGFVAAASIADYEQGIIKKHENTRSEKEEDRIRHVEACMAQTGPIFLAYRDVPELAAIMERVCQQPPLLSFAGDEGADHSLWRVEDQEDAQAIGRCFAAMDAIYIADGHHRCASAVRVGQRMRDQGADGEHASQFFLSVLFPQSHLHIMDYNRLVEDLAGMDEEEFLSKLGEDFVLIPQHAAYAPVAKGEWGMCLGGRWYAMRPKFLPPCEGIEALDVSILQDRVLGPLLGIQDPKTDRRIQFAGGIRGLGYLEERVAGDMAVAFSIYPTSMEELFAVADAGLLMPPKSTWFEPKLRSGIFFRKIDE